MASSVIHMAVASEINKQIKRDVSKLLIGTIAPDISKLVGDSKIKSHFISSGTGDIPNIEQFLNKYEKNLDDDFVMGYYIHLYTDYLWFKYFIEDVDYSSVITTIDGNKVRYDYNTFIEYVYNDYTNLNIKIIDKYNLNLKIFYNEIPEITYIIKEIPMDKLDIIINKTSEIIANTKENKPYLFDIHNIDNFIKLATEIILCEINNLKIN